MFLLQHSLTDATSISELKNSKYSQFLNKPKIKQCMAYGGNGHVTPELLMAMWQDEIFHFTISYDQWGGDCPSWQQTCRKGYNLVLQLNFTRSHDRKYEKVVLENASPFTFSCHPVSSKRHTMAWSRLDFSSDFTEVLIEEVQNDWLREAHEAVSFLQNPKNDNSFKRWGIKPDIKLLNSYFETEIKPIQGIWDEAILCATLEFLVKEIGVKHVYYYEHNTGVKLKSLKYSQPPKSLYTKLPRKFAFEKVDSAPQFIAEDKYAKRKLKKIGPQKWYYLKL